MEVCTYSGSQTKAGRPGQAESKGKVIIRRKDGRTFGLVPEQISG